eukprot:gnl/Hemi2/21170_TR7019_c0_g1_i1.p1 gnl/Hemi2/21170_TR7019_c0_g1~~gnl/Hemi2/21170_TR7019_c0_g1_i1.p1  ORF type:complete len:174 (-),score=54.73 gnl/Hemi2/21170_TR7019_c0_g1_i1:130-651(-)
MALRAYHKKLLKHTYDTWLKSRGEYDGYVPRLAASTTQHIPGCQPARACRLYRNALKSVRGKVSRNHIFVRFPGDFSCYWPQIRAEFDKQAELRDVEEIEATLKRGEEMVEDVMQWGRSTKVVNRPHPNSFYGHMYGRNTPPSQALCDMEAPWLLSEEERAAKGYGDYEEEQF